MSSRSDSRSPGPWNKRDAEHLRRIFAARPEVEAQLGGTDWAHTLGALDAEARLRLLDLLVGWRADLETQMNDSPERMLDVRVFSASLELFRFTEESIAMHRKDPDVATPLFETLLYHLRGHATDERTRFATLASRLRGVSEYFAGARGEVTEPSAELVLRARDVIDGGPDVLRVVAEAARRATATGVISAAANAEVQAAVEAAGSALDEQRAWLATLELRPHEPIGQDAFQRLLLLRGLDLSVSEVLVLAREHAERLRVEESRAARRSTRKSAGPTSTSAAVAAARGATTPQGLAEAVVWTSDLVNAARSFLETSGGIALPQIDSERILVDGMPAAFAPSGQCMMHLAPQPLAPSQDSLLLLREPLGPQADALAELSVADLESAVAAFGYPGRHLQSVWSNRATTAARRGVPLGAFGAVAGAWGQDMIQGWALTAEELMREFLFRPSPASRLIMIRRALAAPLLTAVDVCLQVGRMTPEQAAGFLVRRAGLRLPVARAQVRALLRSPTVGLSAFIGKVRIEQLRHEAHKLWRSDYNEKRFHSLLLVSGPLPLAYLFERLNEPPPFVSSVQTMAYQDPQNS